MEIEKLTQALRASWSAETAYNPAEWSPENPARGQCVVSSLIVQDILGGELVRFAVEYRGNQEKHYANVVDGALIDVTRSQYGSEGTFVESMPDLGEFTSLRERVLSDADTVRRYELLRYSHPGLNHKTTLLKA